jgi:hypothetical protein
MMPSIYGNSPYNEAPRVDGHVRDVSGSYTARIAGDAYSTSGSYYHYSTGSGPSSYRLAGDFASRNVSMLLPLVVQK